MNQLVPREVWSLDTVHIGRRVLVFGEVDSTNSLAARCAATENESVAIVADFQTAGRGQYGRTWQSRPLSSLLMSVVLRPPPALRRPVILTAFAAVAVADAIYACCCTQVQIKWPNDLLIRNKKCCGLLIELHGETAIVGIGLNLAQSSEELNAQGLPDATSLSAVAGKDFDLRAVCEAVLRALDGEYHRLVQGETTPVEAEWKWRVGLLGKQVEIELVDGAKVYGRLHEMGFGGLELELADGVFQCFLPERIAHLRRQMVLM
jgi:BirA family biotin operon repressor/biotin-[acetyl-CoA-carboxylase] ligase